MSKPFTLQDIKQSKVAAINQHILNTPKSGELKKADAQKAWIERELKIWCGDTGCQLVTEYVFAKPRRWRFDWAITDRMIAIEYEGIYSKKSRHTTQKGYTNDTEKYNQAAKLGWTVLRYTAKTYKNVVVDLFTKNQ